ncbi:hypothetical protein T484DRAFT_1918350, partial [Baffinella frigidus]
MYERGIVCTAVTAVTTGGIPSGAGRADTAVLAQSAEHRVWVAATHALLSFLLLIATLVVFAVDRGGGFAEQTPCPTDKPVLLWALIMSGGVSALSVTSWLGAFAG